MAAMEYAREDMEEEDAIITMADEDTVVNMEEEEASSTAPNAQQQRITRKKYRELKNKLEENRRDFVHNIAKLRPVLEEINNNLVNITTTTEMTLGTSVILQASQILNESFRNIKLGREQFDMLDFLDRVVEKFGLSDTDPDIPIDYSRFTEFLGPVLQRAPNFSLINGPMDVQVQRREFQRRRQNTEARQVVCGSTKISESDDADKTTSKLVLELYRCLCEQNTAIPFYAFVLNPKSFSQTVENIFCVSFMIKDALASLTLNEENELILEAMNQGDSSEASQERLQWVASISMDEWKDLMKIYEVTDKPLYVSHRSQVHSEPF